MAQESDDRIHGLIKKVLDNLFEEQPTYDEALVVWQNLGMYLSSHQNKVSSLDAITNMLYYTKAMYKDIVTKKIIEN